MAVFHNHLSSMRLPESGPRDCSRLAACSRPFTIRDRRLRLCTHAACQHAVPWHRQWFCVLARRWRVQATFSSRHLTLGGGATYPIRSVTGMEREWSARGAWAGLDAEAEAGEAADRHGFANVRRV